MSPTTGWWFKPDFIINELNVNSAITSPAHDEEVPYVEETVVKGYAYAGVLISVLPPSILSVLMICASAASICLLTQYLPPVCRRPEDYQV